MSNVIELNKNVNGVRIAIKTAIDGGMTYRSIAKESGISTAAISQFMGENYPGDNNEIARKLQVWLDNQQVRRVDIPTVPAFVETETVKKIWSALQYAQLAQRIAVIYGVSGVGKSMALREFAKERPNVWLVTVSPSTASLLECLYEIADVVGVGDAPRRAGSLGRVIRRKITGTQGLLIIDEADHLGYEVLEELRLIQETTGIGLAFCGNHQVYAKLSGGGSRRTDFARLFSRIAKKVAILETTRNDVNAIADAWRLNGSNERKLIHTLGDKAGALRTVSTTLALASMFAVGAQESLSENHIRAAVKDLEGV